MSVFSKHIQLNALEKIALGIVINSEPGSFFSHRPGSPPSLFDQMQKTLRALLSPEWLRQVGDCIAGENSYFFLMINGYDPRMLEVFEKVLTILCEKIDLVKESFSTDEFENIISLADRIETLIGHAIQPIVQNKLNTLPFTEIENYKKKLKTILLFLEFHQLEFTLDPRKKEWAKNIAIENEGADFYQFIEEISGIMPRIELPRSPHGSLFSFRALEQLLLNWKKVDGSFLGLERLLFKMFPVATEPRSTTIRHCLDFARILYEIAFREKIRPLLPPDSREAIDAKMSNFARMVYITDEERCPTEFRPADGRIILGDILVYLLPILLSKSTRFTTGTVDRRFYSSKALEWPEFLQTFFDLAEVVFVRDSFLSRILMTHERFEVSPTGKVHLLIQGEFSAVISLIGKVAMLFAPKMLKFTLMDLSSIKFHEFYLTNYGAQPKQRGGTCYANACATLLHFACCRVYNRDGGYPSFSSLREVLIGCFGDHGESLDKVLTSFCNKDMLRLRYEKHIDESKAKQAILRGRPIGAVFYLTEAEWRVFSDFWKTNKSRVLRRGDLGPPSGKREGHAVVLHSFTEDRLIFLNSWGKDWGDKGFFYVENRDTLNFTFYDVFFVLDDLNEVEKLI